VVSRNSLQTSKKTCQSLLEQTETTQGSERECFLRIEVSWRRQSFVARCLSVYLWLALFFNKQNSLNGSPRTSWQVIPLSLPSFLWSEEPRWFLAWVPTLWGNFSQNLPLQLNSSPHFRELFIGIPWKPLCILLTPLQKKKGEKKGKGSERQ